ncbi:hypothetical protein BpHYR1_020746 [Brachionus plicatilis]|uniref:Uncharacterized protein n=1 Tax=Brachionus plicatilis TaxID=10195 RepID=A0A3M7QD85_BRAPC|nr:hypothetical protein BpHYR1_020746 [Brachionus plicatilis]
MIHYPDTDLFLEKKNLVYTLYYVQIKIERPRFVIALSYITKNLFKYFKKKVKNRSICFIPQNDLLKREIPHFTSLSATLNSFKHCVTNEITYLSPKILYFKRCQE